MTSSPETVFQLRRTRVPMPDGVELATDVYLPGTEGRWPVLLVRTPYGKESSFQTQHMLNLDVVVALAAGFAVVLQDTRGRGASDGRYRPFLDDSGDAWATLEWISTQSFSTGWVGMYGASYVGATQWLAAKSRHPALRAIVPVLTMDHFREDWTYAGGALQLGFVGLWMIETLAPIDLEQRAGEPGLDECWNLLRTLQEDPTAALSRRPIAGDDIERLAPYFTSWLSRPVEDEGWAGIDVSRTLPALPIRGLHVVGFNDIFCDGGLAAYARATAPDAPAADQQYLIAGPWSHGNYSDWQGGRWHGYQAAAGGMDLQGKQLEFFRAGVEGRSPVLPKVQYFTSGTDRWHEAETWPPPGVEPLSLFLTADRRLEPKPGDPGRLEVESDPDDPVPTAGGASFLQGLLQGVNSGPRRQGEIEARPDVLVFTSEPLADDLTVTGTVTAELWGACDQADCDWTIRLCDVDPQGNSTGIVDGIQRVRFLPEGPRTPGEFGWVRVRVGATSHVFRAGHRLRVQVAGSNFPRFDRNPHALVNPGLAVPEEFVVARQMLGLGGAHPSRIVLPVHGSVA